MKIAVSANGRDLDAAIDPRFGRCAWFIIVETGDMSFEAFANDSGSLGGGAGIQSAQFVASKGAVAVLTGNCGPNAVQTLNAAGIELFVNQSGTVKEAVQRHIKGLLNATTQPNVTDHHGMGDVAVSETSQAVSPAPGMASAGGQGGGMGGCGCGRGQGRGMGGGKGGGGRCRS
ncbi:dinitrogenase iron-molybdenum cofactor biosynthe sis protein [Desulfonema ishimotonii]|uniref:Dinitrogenase iron-molybdenum cofactor biosynthe sis protein n=1 Tax=Desulfonema ishimotonii TaxID=45657 RepID=A0A401FSC3_9BACT|nr:NifB/NifX family molybdenum-iron cluster-binding protein [Desulfonema ishimotonii]GBC59853.1 dinitrogenase iron-molybdenum cofactor biosynthe sis protein [Desulfonema ishimotonii]